MTDPSPARPRYRKPKQDDRIDLGTLSEQAAFDAIAAKSQQDTLASAERWRTGLAALTSVITAGLLIKGPTNATELDPGWRAGLTTLFAFGIGTSVIGLWLALRASAGVPTTLTFDELRRRYGTVRLYQLDIAQRAQRDLRRAKVAAIAALLVLGAAVLAWWWAPVNKPEPPVATVRHGAQQSCGVIVNSDASGLRLAQSSSPARVTIPWQTITAIQPGTSCTS
jgi:hypothetical protein